MSNRMIAVLVAVMAAWSFVEGRVEVPWGSEAPVVEEIRRSVALEPGARVEVASRGGRFTVETADIAVAEIHVVRTAPTRCELRGHRVTIEGSASRLVVRAESPRAIESDDRVSQHVTLRVPRSVTVSSYSFEEAVPVG